MKIVGEAQSGMEVVNLVRKCSPHVVITDIVANRHPWISAVASYLWVTGPHSATAGGSDPASSGSLH